jgi:hypothetical protein
MEVGNRGNSRKCRLDDVQSLGFVDWKTITRNREEWRLIVRKAKIHPNGLEHKRMKIKNNKIEGPEKI